MRKPHVLLVEDHNVLRELLAATLRKEAFRVTAVDSGCTAMRVMPVENFDVIVTDILMPGSDGLEVIGFAKSTQPAAQIVAMSGGSAGLEPELCLRMAKSLGAHRLLMKPFTTDEFLSAVACTGLAGDTPGFVANKRD